MVISKNAVPNTQITIDQKIIERVKKYNYLGTNLNNQWDHSKEILSRIEEARAVFIKMNNVFKSHDLKLTTKMRLLRCYVAIQKDNTDFIRRSCDK